MRLFDKLKHRYSQFRQHPIASKNLLRAMGKYALFNLLPTKNRVYNFINPVKFWARRGDAGIVANIYTGLFEYEEMSFVLHFLRPDDLFVDIGANVGEYTLLASGYAGAKSISIEPVSFTFEKLKKNIELNALQQSVTVLKVGLSSSPGVLHFSTNKGVMNHVVSERTANSESVAVNTLDQVLEGLKANLIKIDVEGFEAEVLAGAVSTLQSPNLEAIIVELNSFGSSFNSSNEAVHQNLLKNGFRPAQYFPFDRKIQLLESYRRDQFNTLYVRNMETLQKRILRGKKIEIFGLSY